MTEPSAEAWALAKDTYQECVEERGPASLHVAMALALDAFAAKARAAAFEEAAQLVVRVAEPNDDSALGEACADAYNSGTARRSVTDRLVDYSAVLAAGIRALAAREPGDPA